MCESEALLFFYFSISKRAASSGGAVDLGSVKDKGSRFALISNIRIPPGSLAC